MKTRALARSLRLLADWLEQFPDQNLEGLVLDRADTRQKSASLALNLATLAALSRIDKAEWINFINQHGFPIEMRPRDATRDILGKLLKFLEEEPSAIEYLQDRAHTDSVAPPALSQALRALLEYQG